MLTLHWSYMAGSLAVQAALEEIGAPYRLNFVDLDTEENLKAAHLAVNPTGFIPAVTFPGGQSIGETAAILTQLGEMFPAAGLTPQPGDKDRPHFLYWLNVMATSGGLTAGRIWHPERFSASQLAMEDVSAFARIRYDAHFDLLEANVAGEAAFLGRGFSSLDIYLAMLSEWHFDKALLFADRPKVAAICASVAARPSYRNVMETHVAA